MNEAPSPARLAKEAAAEAAHEPYVLRAQSGGIVTLTLNRPAQFNPLSEEMIGALERALDAVAADRSAQVVILAAAGKAFCAGHDLKQMRRHAKRAYQIALFEKCSAMMMKLREIPQPVIARVHGIATAAGCQLVAACDLAVASRQASFATSGINLGLFCSTPAVAVSRNVAAKPAFEMLFTGDFIAADEAVRIGLINRAVAPEALDGAVAALAAKIAAKSKLVVGIGKGMFYRQLAMELGEAYKFAAGVMADNMMAQDAQDGIDAFINKKPPPKWQGK